MTDRYELSVEHAGEMAALDEEVARCKQALGDADYALVLAEVERSRARQRLAEVIERRFKRGHAIALMTGLDVDAIGGSWQLSDGSLVKVA